MILSGLAQMPAFTAISPELIDLFGGRQTARTLHVVCMLWMILFLVVHVVEVFVAGAVNEIRSMITGKYLVPKEDAE
jgi:thiosulfate reductase cytochrome b subunit